MCNEKFIGNNSHFDEVELSIIKDENPNLIKDNKTSIFDGITLDEITFSTMDNNVTLETKDKSNMENTSKSKSEKREIQNIDAEELEREIDEILERILQEKNGETNTEKP